MYTTLLIGLALATLFFYLKTRFTYWKSRAVPTLHHRNIIFGDIAATIFGRENFCTTIQNAYTEFRKRGHKFGGLYFLNNPILLITDPDVAKLVMVKDFDHFVDRGIKHDVVNNPLSGNMFNLNGDDWKFIRHKLSPAFTSGKLKNMMGAMEEHIDILCGVLNMRCDEDVIIFKLLERLGIDIIGHTAFGLNCNAQEGGTSKFHEMTAKLFTPKIWDVIKILKMDAFKNPVNLIRLLTSDPTVEAFFINLVRETVQYREKNNVKANDFMQILIELLKPDDDNKRLTVEEITAEAFLFFLAAYETQSKAMNLCLYELGKDADLQDALRKEICEGLEESDGKFDFDIVMDLKLLDRIISEALRKHPSVLFINRICTKEYHVPNHPVVIEEGTPVIVPIYAFHHDPVHFDHPDVFDQNRFTKENIEKIKPYTYFPFGEGPRYCIGKRMALLQMKLTIMKLIKNFEFSVSPKTEDPPILDPVTKNLLLSYRGNIWFTVKRVN